MQISIVCVGKVKEKFYRDALAEYGKRLGRYTKFSIVEVSDEKTPDHPTDVEKEQILSKEAERILSKLSEKTYVIALAIEGKRPDSVELAEHLQKLMLTGKSNIAFVIGGSLGLHPDVIKRSDETLSFSAMTFPHQLMRVILAEQIYRSFRIISNEPYHK
ncbi:23S rRNA (pseudouridine1915-N3)-methyltransferase [Lachnospiraceae bacterium KHCPX20]|nr:23S rRNA (pseudouridine1915-N3)-methyltransferase [Lachnospiraceae bacterium KHCPX20]